MKNILITTLFLYTNIVLYGQCTSAGPVNASSFYKNLSFSTPQWSNLSDAQLSDNSYATAGQAITSNTTVRSNYLVFSNPGFSLPGNAVICGIQVDVERSAAGLIAGASVTDNSIRIVRGGVIMDYEQASGSLWPSTDTYTTYGSNVDTWGINWSAADINAPDFGFAISASLSAGADPALLTAQVDHIRATVFYTVLLPMTLKNFNARQISNRVKLEWVTASEFNNSHFLAERSVNNYSWSTIDSIPGAGYSYTDKYYVAYDNSPEPVNYYRLKQVDLAGKITISKVIQVKISNIHGPITSISPNPVSSLLTVSNTEEIKDFHLYTINSSEVFPTLYQAQRSSRIYNVNRLSPGIYFARIYSGNDISTQKIIVMK